MELRSIIRILEEWAPPSLQEGYDNSKLITGHPKMMITAALATLDCTEEVVDEAITANCNLIIAHHPIVFSGLKSFTGKNYVEQTVIKAIKNDIAIYAIHTNLDNINSGVNRKIGEKLGLQQLSPLAPKKGLLQKLYTYVPVSHAEVVRDALFAAGAGHIGAYSECSFSSEGTGTFKAGADTNPYVGTVEARHEERELKLEVVLPNYNSSQVVTALKKAHPYEEVAYDIVSLENHHDQVGSGMIGELTSPESIEQFMGRVAKQFNCPVIRHTVFSNTQVKRVAFCGGAGQFLLSNAKAAKADVFITGDFKYHEFFDAENQITIMDIGHFESEQFTPELIQEFLEEKIPTFAVLLSEVKTNPVHYFIS